MKESADLGTLVKEHGLPQALSHKFLEFRGNHPMVNSLLTQGILGHINSSAYTASYVASWDNKGRLAYFKEHQPGDNHIITPTMYNCERKDYIPTWVKIFKAQ